MPIALSLPELERQFMAALYDAKTPGPLASIAGNGLNPEARLRIYRRSCNETQTATLRTTYPAMLALVGEAFFDQIARSYRHAHPSHSGNLQVIRRFARRIRRDVAGMSVTTISTRRRAPRMAAPTDDPCAGLCPGPSKTICRGDPGCRRFAPDRAASEPALARQPLSGAHDMALRAASG